MKPSIASILNATALVFLLALSAHADSVPWVREATPRDHVLDAVAASPMVEPNGIVTIDQKSLLSGGKKSRKVRALQTVTLTDSATPERRLFRQAVKALKAGDTIAADQTFNTVIRDYPATVTAERSAFLSAKMAENGGEFTKARDYYDLISSSKVGRKGRNRLEPAACLEAAKCSERTKENKEARRRLKEIIQKFPHTPEARTARARLKAMRDSNGADQ